MRYERKGAAVGSFLLMRSALLACAILCMLGMLAIASLDPACAWAEERIGSINVHALQSNTDGIPAEDGQENHPSVLPSFRFAAGEWSGLRVGEAFLRCSRCKRERSRRYGGCRTSGLVRFQNRRDGRCGNLRVRGAWARRLSSDSGRRHRACPGAEEFSGGGAHAKRRRLSSMGRACVSKASVGSAGQGFGGMFGFGRKGQSQSRLFAGDGGQHDGMGLCGNFDWLGGCDGCQRCDAASAWRKSRCVVRGRVRRNGEDAWVTEKRFVLPWLPGRGLAG